MTDPSNIQQIKDIIKPSDATAVTYFRDLLWVGDKTGNVYVASKTDKGGKSSFTIKYTLSPIIRNHLIKTLIPVEDPCVMIVHYTTLADAPGPVEIVRRGGIRTTIPQNASIALTSGKKANPRIVLVNDKAITGYCFCGGVLLQDFTFDAPSKVRAAAMTEKTVIYCCDKTYYSYDISTKATRELASALISTPIVHNIGNNQLLVTYQEFMNIQGGTYDANGETTNYHPTYGPPLAFYGPEKALYQFFQKNFIRSNLLTTEASSIVFDVPGVRLYTMIKTDLLIITNDAWKIVGSIPPPSDLLEMLTGGQAERVYKLLTALSPDQASESAIGIFNLMWPKDQMGALDFLTKFTWLSHPRELLSLFEDLKLPGTRKARISPTIQIAGNKNYINIYTKLAEVLEKNVNDYVNEGLPSIVIRYATTALAEVYAIIHETRKLNDIIIQNNEESLDKETLWNFVETANSEKKFPVSPALAVLKTRKGDISEAVNIWKQLYETTKDTAYLTNCSFTLQECSDQDFFIKTIDWIYPNCPSAAINSLLSKNHDTTMVLNWLAKNNREQERILYIDYLMCLPDYTPSVQLIDECFKKYIILLSGFDSDKYKEEDIKFTSAARIQKLTGNELKAAAKEEINTKAIRILEQHSKFISAEKYLSYINSSIDPKIALTIYRVTGKYLEALTLILKGKDPIPFEEVEEFCRAAPDPPQAFQAAFTLIGADKLFDKKCEFISRNISYIDPVSTIKMIPKDTPVKQVADVIRILFNLLVQRNESLDKQIAVTESMKVDAEYKLAKARSSSVVIDKTTVCATCGKPINDGQIYVDPDGTVYHGNETCKKAKSTF